MRPISERGVLEQSPTVIGHSVLGAPIELFCAPEAADLLIVANIHGDEPETGVLLSRAMRQLDAKEITCDVILSLNPDGLNRGTRANVNGVDLNRNFPSSTWDEQPVLHKWIGEHGREVILSPGRYAGSEPETAALMQVIKERKPHLVIALHAPLACIEEATPSVTGQWLAQTTDLQYLNGIGYPTPGSLDAYLSERGIHSITYEFEADESIRGLRDRHEHVLVSLLTGEYPRTTDVV